MKFLLLALILFVFFDTNAQSLKKIASLPKVLNESSGLVMHTDTTFLSINDSGGEAAVYEFSILGNIVSTTTFKNVINYDWEEITIDSLGFIYIGDIGNNLNIRNNLTIYKFHSTEIGKDSVVVEQIDFYYPEQMSFPPSPEEMHYDAEGFIIWNDEIILFTKCRTKPFRGQTLIYSIPNKAGRHDAFLINSLVIGTKSWRQHSVTAMCRYNNGIAILTYSGWYEVKQFDPRGNFWTNGNVVKHSLPFFRQREGITQGFDGIIYITDEKHPLLGGANLYKWIGKEEK